MTPFCTGEPVDVVAGEYRIPPERLDANDRQPGGVGDLFDGGKSVSQVFSGVPRAGAGRSPEMPTTGDACGEIPVAVLS